MSEANVSNPAAASPDRAEDFSALFASLVMQQANLAMMLLGQTPHPETGQVTKDIEAARLFIDYLEMLEAKTKGNLSKPEEHLLKQSLMTLRMAFVEAVDHPETKPGQSSPAEAAPQATPAPAAGSEPESAKKFSKKY